MLRMAGGHLALSVERHEPSVIYEARLRLQTWIQTVIPDLQLRRQANLSSASKIAEKGKLGKRILREKRMFDIDKNLAGVFLWATG
jgi:hypothetical protein